MRALGNGLVYQGNAGIAGFLRNKRLIDRRHVLKVAALYQFAALPDYRELREPLRAICAGLGLKGSILLAAEGINGTVAGSDDGIDALVAELRQGALFGGRLDHLELKFSRADVMPFGRMKVRLKKEIVTLGEPKADPTRQVGIYVEPADWNALIASPDTLVIDTRNAFEVAIGTFEGAVDPGIASFGQFKDFVARTARSGEAQEDRDVLHRRHPLREGELAVCSRRASPRSITSRAAS